MPAIKEAVTFLFGIALVSASSYTFADSMPLNNHSQNIDGYSLTLSNDNSECELITGTDDKKASLALPLTPPCYWITKPESEEAQHYAYASEEISHVFLVAGTALEWSDEKKEYNKLPIDAYCSQYLQGITVQSGEVIISGKKMDAPNCIGQDIDEKVFNGVTLGKATEETAEIDKLKPENKEGLFDSIKKTFKQLFSSEEETPQSN